MGDLKTRPIFRDLLPCINIQNRHEHEPPKPPKTAYFCDFSQLHNYA